MSDLLPCPFCGGAVTCDEKDADEYGRPGWFIECATCDQSFFHDDPYASRQFLSEHWNTRAAATREPRVSKEALEWFHKANDESTPLRIEHKLKAEILAALSSHSSDGDKTQPPGEAS